MTISNVCFIKTTIGGEGNLDAMLTPVQSEYIALRKGEEEG
jgi:hypothetical protein